MTKDTEKAIRKTLAVAGITENLRGFYYIIDAVDLLLSQDISVCETSITKNIYPAVAAKREISSSKVERNIRYAIEASFENCLFASDFPLSPKGCCRPTNGQFLKHIAAIISGM